MGGLKPAGSVEPSSIVNPESRLRAAFCLAEGGKVRQESGKGLPEGKIIIREGGISLPESKKALPEDFAGIRESKIAIPLTKFSSTECGKALPVH